METPQIQHSHRHDDMEIMILADEELVKFSDFPVTPGITAQLVRAEKQTKGRRSNACFACKHCVPNPCKYRIGYVGGDCLTSLSCSRGRRDREEY